MRFIAEAGPSRVAPLYLSTLALFVFAGCGGAPPPAPVGPQGPDSVDAGYGEMSEDQLVQSSNTVRGDDGNAPQFRSMVEMLGRLPGVRVVEQPYGGTTLRIRGSSSFMANEEPLVIIDGVASPSLDGLMAMNANDIASVRVLTDAGETAVYGSRGANGVILVRTKR